MASDGAQEAERQARALTRERLEVGRVSPLRPPGGTVTASSAHDDHTPRGMDWLQPRIDLLTRARRGMQPDAQDASTSAP